MFCQNSICCLVFLKKLPTFSVFRSLERCTPLKQKFQKIIILYYIIHYDGSAYSLHTLPQMNSVVLCIPRSLFVLKMYNLIVLLFLFVSTINAE